MSEIEGYRAYDLPVASLSTIVILAVTLLTGVKHGLKTGFFCFGGCLLASSLWVFLAGMLAVVLDRGLQKTGRPFRVALGLLALVKNLGLVGGPIALSMLFR